MGSVLRSSRVTARACALFGVFASSGLGAVPPAAALADLLVPKSGPKVNGRLVRQDATGVLFNPWWSSNPAMTWEVVRLTPEQVKKVEVEPRAEPEFYRRLQALDALEASDAEALLALGAWAKERKLKAQAEMAFALAAAVAPTDAAALHAVGGAARLAALARGNPSLDADLRAALGAYAAEPDAAARAKRAADLKVAGQPYKPEELERLRRSALQTKGRQDDVPLSMHADRYPGARYTRFVPERYDPAVPWPLLIGLHGGGPDGKDGQEVVGSGDSAMNFYADLAARHGVLVACPDAIQAGWGAKVNEELVRDVILEMRLSFHVDVDRIHLTGHSMGGYGTWALGPRMADLFATVSPAAGAGSGGVSELVKTRTPIFIYHSADDFIDVGPDRSAAQQLREAEADFVYTELEKEGHGYPDAVRRELFEFLLPRRNFDPAYKDAWPRSSLLGPAAGKVTAEEKAYLGDPLALDATPSLDELLGGVALGGGRALRAVAILASTKPSGAAEGLVKLLRDEKVPPHARAEVARALGTLGEPSACPALRKAVNASAGRLHAGLVVACARALAALSDRDGGESLLTAVAHWTTWFDERRMGEQMCFSDWQRSVRTLAEIVEAVAALGSKDAVTALEKTVVARVFGEPPQVQTSERVPQDPSVARVALAQAVGRAYAKAAAAPARWDALLTSLGHDEKARAAAGALRP